MHNLITTIIFVYLTTFSYAQGGWNIDYIHVDSINQKHIGRVIRIDFKSNNDWTNSKEKRGIRSYVAVEDTATINIGTTEYILVERRKIYVDHGIYDEQHLECINCRKQRLILYDATILDVDEKSIQFQLDIEITNTDKTIVKQTKIIRIDRNKLDGVMYQR